MDDQNQIFVIIDEEKYFGLHKGFSNDICILSRLILFSVEDKAFFPKVEKMHNVTTNLHYVKLDDYKENLTKEDLDACEILRKNILLIDGKFKNSRFLSIKELGVEDYTKAYCDVEREFMLNTHKRRTFDLDEILSNNL